MSISLIALSLLSGWCGTVPRPYFPPLPPKPRPVCIRCSMLAAFGGLIAAAVFTQGFAVEASIVPVVLTGFVGGRFASDVYKAVNIEQGES